MKQLRRRRDILAYAFRQFPEMALVYVFVLNSTKGSDPN